MKVGGIDSAIPIEEVEEAVICTKPTITYTTPQLVFGLILGAIKLIPITLLIMACVWGLGYFVSWATYIPYAV